MYSLHNWNCLLFCSTILLFPRCTRRAQRRQHTHTIVSNAHGIWNFFHSIWSRSRTLRAQWPQLAAVSIKRANDTNVFFSCRPHLQQKVALYWIFPGKWMSKPLTHSSFSLTLLVFNLCSGWAPKMLIDFQQVADVMVITSAAADLFAGIRTFTKSILLDAHHNRSGGAKYGNCDIFSFLVKLTTSQNGNDSIVVRLGIAIQKRSDEWMKTEVTFKEPEVIDKHRTKVNETDQRGRAQKNRFWLRQILCISVYICRDENAFENGPMHFHLHVPLFQAFKSVCIFISQFTSSGA